MTTLSKVWGVWLLLMQAGNAVLALLSTLIAIPDDATGPLAVWKAKALGIHVTVSVVLAGLQAIAKSLTDADGDGTPDVFQGPRTP